MINLIKSIPETRFDQRGIRILWVESFIFSVIFAVMFKTWVVGCNGPMGVEQARDDLRLCRKEPSDET